MSKYLITTAIEETWPESGEVVFLGEWCKLYNRQMVWKNYNSKTIQYHWNKKSKLEKDYLYLQNFYESLLPLLSNRLNEIHKIDEPLKYWRILIGPWLGYFTKTVYDRWFSIKTALEIHQDIKTIILNDIDQPTPHYDFDDFRSKTNDDLWNHFLFKEILIHNKFTEFVSSKRDTKKKQFNQKSKNKINLKTSLKSALAAITNLFSKNDDVLIYSTGLKLKDQFNLSRDLRQFYRYNYVPILKKSYNESVARNWSLEHSSLNPFEKFTAKIISKNIPIVYLEGYKALKSSSEKLKMPNNPSSIMTGHIDNDIFKEYVAKNITNGSKLIISQHGGGPFHRFNGNVEHNIKICDQYLSTGNGNSIISNKIKDVGQIYNPINKMKFDPKGSMTIFQVMMPRYSSDIRSFALSSQMLNYFDNQFLFYKKLNKHICDNSIIRPYPQDYGWRQSERWVDQFSNSIKIENKKKSIQQIAETSRLIVSTYTGTVHNECIASDVPVIMFWDEKYWQYHQSFYEIFKELEEVEIFHKSPLSAAEHVNRIWENIDEWWSEPSVVKAKKLYCRKFANREVNIIDRISNVLAD